MGRAPCCEKIGVKRGKWTEDEDDKLAKYIAQHGEGSWELLAKNTGILRCGKSCRLRWLNYLRDGVRRGKFSKEEDDIIFKLHATFGNRWSLIASHLSGRSDNEVKNYWKYHLSRQYHNFKKTTITIDINKISTAYKRRGGRALGSNTKKQSAPEPTKSKEEGSRPNHPINNINCGQGTACRMPCSDKHMVMDPVDQNGGENLEPNCANDLINQIPFLDESEMEAMLSSIDDIPLSGLMGIEHGCHQSPVDNLLDMDWDDLASHLWDQPAPSDLLQTIKPQVTTVSKPDDLEPFISWLLSDVC
ncbi:Myb-related protein P [Hordeum vulgare]|nr:Myb-related protein P [Hordeum vulgare]